VVLVLQDRYNPVLSKWPVEQSECLLLFFVNPVTEAPIAAS